MRVRELGWVLLSFAVVAVVWTWPLARTLATEVPYDGRFAEVDDAPAWSSLWRLDHARSAVREGRSPFRTDRAFYPSTVGLVRADPALPWAWATWPLAALGGHLCAYGVGLLLLFATAATATYALARALGLSRPAAALSAFAGSFSPWFVRQGLDGIAVGVSPWPALAAGLARSVALATSARSRVLRAAGLGLVLGLAAWTSLVGLAWLVPIVAVVLGATARELRASSGSARGWLGGLGGFVPTFGLLIAPIVVQLAGEGELGASARRAAARPRASAPVELRDFVTPPGLHPLSALHPVTRLGSARAREGDSEDSRRARAGNGGLYLGVGLLTLFALGASAGRRAAWAAALVAIGVAATWDPGQLLSTWIARVPGLEAFARTALWLPVATFGLAIGAGLGLDELVRRRRGRAAATALAALVLFESWIGPYPTAPLTVPAAVRAIAEGPGTGAVLTLPLPAGPHVSDAWALVHRRPQSFRWMDHGAIARGLQWHVNAPDLHRLARALAGDDVELPSPEGLSFDLEALGVDHVLGLPELPPRIRRLLDAMDRWERGPEATTPPPNVDAWHRSGLRFER